MYRIYLCILFVLLPPFFQGCGMLDFLKGDTGDETRSVEAKKTQVQNEVDRLRAENTGLKNRMDLMKKEAKLSMEGNVREMKKLEEERDSLNEELRKLREDNKRIALENKECKEKLQKREKTVLADLKIKVLSGDGDLRSAKNMTKKLMGMDYVIRLIGYAPRSNFKKNTVYFKPRAEKEGKLLVSKIGIHTAIKPLTWPSIFDLIVVTGKNP